MSSDDAVEDTEPVNTQMDDENDEEEDEDSSEVEDQDEEVEIQCVEAVPDPVDLGDDGDVSGRGEQSVLGQLVSQNIDDGPDDDDDSDDDDSADVEDVDGSSESAQHAFFS